MADEGNDELRVALALQCRMSSERASDLAYVSLQTRARIAAAVLFNDRTLNDDDDDDIVHNGGLENTSVEYLWHQLWSICFQICKGLQFECSGDQRAPGTDCSG
jgi:hypothetical protein